MLVEVKGLALAAFPKGSCSLRSRNRQELLHLISAHNIRGKFYLALGHCVVPLFNVAAAARQPLKSMPLAAKRPQKEFPPLARKVYMSFHGKVVSWPISWDQAQDPCVLMYMAKLHINGIDLKLVIYFSDKLECSINAFTMLM